MKPLVSIVVPVYNLSEHLEKMLDSVKNQSFKEFEVLMIDDGSTDGSLSIMKRFSEEDPRFKAFTHKNRGVSATRNRGIEEARGDYILFYDGDDYIPKNAVKDMYSAASKAKADITIGVMQVDNDGSLTVATARKLVTQKNICVGDVSFIHAWSVCNKMFSLPFLIHNELRFEEMKHSEDAVFTYATLAKANIVTGCNSIVYKYIKRTFWSSDSATQKVTRDMLKDLLKSHDRILEEANSFYQYWEDKEVRDSYFSKLYARFISNEMLEGFYKRLWVSEEGVTDLILERIEEYKKHINSEDWKRISKKHDDIFDGERLLTPDEIMNGTDIKVFVTKDYCGKTSGAFLKSLYAQQYPKFSVAIEKSLAETIDKEYLDLKNVEVVKDGVVEEALDEVEREVGGKDSEFSYIMMAEDNIYPSKDSLYVLAKALKNNPSISISSCLVKCFDGEGFFLTKEMESAFGYISKPRPIKKVDDILGSKLVRMKDFPINEKSQCMVMRTAIMLSDLREDEFKERYHPAFRPVNYIVNSGVGGAMSYGKRKLAREDVDLILKRFNKDSSGIKLT